MVTEGDRVKEDGNDGKLLNTKDTDCSSGLSHKKLLL